MRLWILISIKIIVLEPLKVFKKSVMSVLEYWNQNLITIWKNKLLRFDGIFFIMPKWNILMVSII